MNLAATTETAAAATASSATAAESTTAPETAAAAAAKASAVSTDAQVGAQAQRWQPAPAALRVVVRGWGAVSALGMAAGPIPATSPFSRHAATGVAVGALPPAAEAALTALRQRRAAYRSLDRSVLLALLAAEQATAAAGWQLPDATRPLAVSLGSSRGATERLEAAYAEFYATGAVPPATSPLTTLGNVASWVADAAGATGAALSHSSTCSTALQALGNAVAWLRAGLVPRFLAGGAEAPLTDFTLAQMRALGIYSPYAPGEWPCRPGAGAPSTFTLGEGAAVFALEALPPAAVPPSALLLESVGFGFEATGTRTGITPDGQHFQQAMQQALTLAGVTPTEVDLLILHSPGTPAGDQAERRAVQAVFGPDHPACTSNKWLLGHTLGASGALSLELALRILQDGLQPHALPFASWLNERPAPARIRRVLVNAAGFGGNAASALVSVAG